MMKLNSFEYLVELYQNKINYYQDVEQVKHLLNQDINLYYLKQKWQENISGIICSGLIESEDKININNQALKEAIKTLKK